MNKNKNFISAVIYIYNAEISGFLKMLYSVLSANFEKFEIICVNDASADFDAGKSVIQELAGSFDNCTLSIINMGRYHGVESAMLAGVDLAIGDFIFEFDSPVIDYNPELILEAYERAVQGCDIVSCGNGRERAASKIFYAVYNRHSGTQYKLRSESFRIISRRAVNRVHSMSVNLPYRKALYSNCGLQAGYIKYEPENNIKKRGQMLKNPHDTALTSLILFTNIAYKITLAFTLIMMCAALAAIIYVISVYLLGNPVEGYTTMMLFMASVFFALFAVLSVIIKYLSVIAGLIFNKQRYVVESIEKIAK